MRDADFKTHDYEYVTITCDCYREVTVYNNCGGENTCECGIKFEIVEQTEYTIIEDGKKVMTVYR